MLIIERKPDVMEINGPQIQLHNVEIDMTRMVLKNSLDLVKIEGCNAN